MSGHWGASGAKVGELVLNFKEFNIGFVLPPSALLRGDLELPCGALICGSFRGHVRCLSGSLILAAGSQFAGRADAEQIYIEGTVQPQDKGVLSEFNASALIAVSRDAIGSGRLSSKAFAIHSRKFGGQFRTLE